MAGRHTLYDTVSKSSDRVMGYNWFKLTVSQVKDIRVSGIRGNRGSN